MRLWLSQPQALSSCCIGVVEQVPSNLIMVLDAAGLGLFAVTGAEKALTYGLHFGPELQQPLSAASPSFSKQVQVRSQNNAGIQVV